MKRFYSPVGRGVALLKPQGSISYVQSDKETYDMDAHDHAMQMVNKLAFENGRLRFLMGEAITSMSHAEIFISSREKMHSTGRQQWGELIDRMRDVLADSEPEPLGDESALLVGGE